MGITVREIIQQLTRSVETIENTVDTLKFGSPSTEVTGIAVAFMPTNTAIQKTIELGANLLITHEGLFFSHWDKYELGDNQVYHEKYKLITNSGIAVYRFHDYVHRYKPDGIMQGLIQALKWDQYVEEHQPAATILTIPPMTVKDIAAYIKDHLYIDFLRYAGDLSMPCTRVGLLAGYRGGGATAIPLCEKQNLDLVIYGEGPEWETPEYIRDASSLDKKRALIILGHAASEEPGMKLLATKMKEMFPGIPVHFIPNEPLFKVI